MRQNIKLESSQFAVIHKINVNQKWRIKTEMQLSLKKIPIVFTAI